MNLNIDSVVTNYEGLQYQIKSYKDKFFPPQYHRANYKYSPRGYQLKLWDLRGNSSIEISLCIRCIDPIIPTFTLSLS